MLLRETTAVRFDDYETTETRCVGEKYKMFEY
jgi:hypothetical protein